MSQALEQRPGESEAQHAERVRSIIDARAARRAVARPRLDPEMRVGFARKLLIDPVVRILTEGGIGRADREMARRQGKRL